MPARAAGPRRFALAALLAGLLAGCSPIPTPPPATPLPAAVPPASPTGPLSQAGALLAHMSLAEKVGQTMILGIEGTSLTGETRRAIEELRPGGVILYDRNVASPRALAQLNADLQAAAQRVGLPGLFICIDQEGGTVARLRQSKGFTEFPGAMALAAGGSPAQAREVARAMAAEMAAVGINMDLAPVLDVNSNPKNPIIGLRSFGSDPGRVAEFGVAFIAGLQEMGVMAVGKHFPGHGDTGVDSHVSLPTVAHGRPRLEEVEFVPFRAALAAGVGGIMSAHVTFPAIDPTPGMPATLSPAVMTGLLRDEMHYEGLLMTDSLAMGALASAGYTPPEAAAAALKAGADLLLFQSGHDLHRAAQARVIEQVRAGQIPEARLDQAVRRILAAKERYGLLDPRPVDPAAATERTGTQQAQALAREAAARAVTLVRDDAHLLPLRPGARLLAVEPPAATGLGRALGADSVALGAAPTSADIAHIVELGRDGRTVIVGTVDAASSPRQAELVRTLVAAGVPTVVIALRSPYDLLQFPEAPTCLATYGIVPGTLEAVAGILSGKARAQGRLPVALPGLSEAGA